MVIKHLDANAGAYIFTLFISLDSPEQNSPNRKQHDTNPDSVFQKENKNDVYSLLKSHLYFLQLKCLKNKVGRMVHAR